MKNGHELFNERLARIKSAVALQPVDRIPVVISNDMFAPTHMGVKMGDFVTDVSLSSKTIIDSAVELGVDGVQFPFMDPRLLSTLWLTKIKLPGVHLPEDALWQAHEEELMTTEDYDVIIDKGWNYFCQDFMLNRLDNVMAKLAPTFAFMPTAYKNAMDAGIVSVCAGFPTPPLEMICGGRSMAKFMTDLYKRADKVQAAFDTAMIDIITNTKALLANKPMGVWVGGWRGASASLSPKLWQRFVWPYIKKLAEVVLEAGVIPIFHLDSNWERDLAFFKEMPKGKCIIFPDSETNIFKIKEILGDHMCINGDVPASLLTLATEEAVYNYSVKLIKEIGPTGFMLGQGCDIPMNAKLENVKAMVAAATGK
jgi:hypothetical protein